MTIDPSTPNIKPLVSVIIPTYNYAHRVTRAILSVQKQTLTNTEIIIVDDGSTDNTAEIVPFFIKDDIRCKYVRAAHAGVAAARNTGLSIAAGLFMCCLDADDQIEPQFLEICVTAMLENPEIGIAFTRLTMLYPDGDRKLSAWPGEPEPDKQFYQKGGNNQVPTCCVFRREMFERTGGYRSRYCPHGAGSEDANLWLRGMSIGFLPRLVSDLGLFIYSIGEGNVTGKRTYEEVDWRAMHPWTRDRQANLFASVATPKVFSHPVKEYDNPMISIIIPVGKYHKSNVFDALDSIESQTFRDWEVILVDDGGDEPFIADGKTDGLASYPYVRYIKTLGEEGAGVARNLGAKVAEAPFLLFLDADDSLMPDALEELYFAALYNNAISYSDYYGKAILDQAEVQKLGNRIVNYDPQTGYAIIMHDSSEYNCERALAEPTQDLYIWNLVSSLVPRAWHEEIGGFDEVMSSWEDWDYWLRLARQGKCFVRVPKPLLVYRFYTGERREASRQSAGSLIEYLRKKYEKDKPMGCNCGKKTQVVPPQPSQGVAAMENVMNDDGYVLIRYMNPNRGEHRVIGPSGQDYGVRPGGGQQTFLVKEDDVRLAPHLYVPVPETVSAPAPTPTPVNRPVLINKPAEKKVEEAPTVEMTPIEVVNYTLQNVPGVSPDIEKDMNAQGIYTVEDISKASIETLIQFKGIGQSRAKMMITYAQKLLEDNTEKTEA